MLKPYFELHLLVLRASGSFDAKVCAGCSNVQTFEHLKFKPANSLRDSAIRQLL